MFCAEYSQSKRKSLQRLLQKPARVADRVVFLRCEELVAVLFVERAGLEAQRVEEGVLAASAAPLVLGHRQQLGAEALAPRRFFQPEDVDVQPAPVALAQQPSGDSTLSVPQ